MYEPDNDPHRYDDIIDLPRPVSAAHRPMPRADRAAQFSPFAALSGHGDAIAETARLTDARRELDEQTQAQLHGRIARLARAAGRRPQVRVTWFIPDPRKAGGRYESAEGRVRRVDLDGGWLIFSDGLCLPLADLTALEGPLFDRAGETPAEE